MLSYKNIFILFLAGALIVAFFVFFDQSPRGEKYEKKIMLVIDYGNGTKRQFRADGVMFEREENAWSVLQRAAATASIPLEVAHGFYPIVINGKRNGEEGKRWVLSVNGKRQSNGAPLEIPIKEGDEVVWKFE